MLLGLTERVSLELRFTRRKSLSMADAISLTLKFGDLAFHVHGTTDVNAVNGVACSLLNGLDLCASLKFRFRCGLQHEVEAVSLGDLLVLNVKVAVLLAAKLADKGNKSKHTSG